MFLEIQLGHRDHTFRLYVTFREVSKLLWFSISVFAHRRAWVIIRSWG